MYGRRGVCGRLFFYERMSVSLRRVCLCVWEDVWYVEGGSVMRSDDRRVKTRRDITEE